jgi:hypothetical protein
MHAAHRGAKDQAQMIYSQPFFQHLVLQQNHVVVVVLRKTSVQAVAGFAGFSVTDVIRQNNVLARDIERLPRPK